MMDYRISKDLSFCLVMRALAVYPSSLFICMLWSHRFYF